MKSDSEKPDAVTKPEAQGTLAATACSAYLVDCNAYGKEPLEYKTISKALADNRIVSVSKEDDGTFCVEEGCDNYFCGYLTREQLLAWAEELKALAGMLNDQAQARRNDGLSKPETL
jgi:hypothetical protein